MSKQPRQRRQATPVTEHRLRDLFTSTFDDARAGDTELMREYINTAAGFIENGTPLPQDLRAHVVTAFKAIGKGADPATALGLKRGRRQSPRLRDLTIAYAVHQLVIQDMSINEASEVVAREYAELVQSRQVRLRDLTIAYAVHQLVIQDMSINESSEVVAREYAELVQSRQVATGYDTSQRRLRPELAGPIVAAPAVKKLYERYRDQLTDTAPMKQRK